MAETIRKTVITQDNTVPTTPTAAVVDTPRQMTPAQTFQYLIYFIFGLIDTLLIFRMLLKLLGASTASGFVRFIYNTTAVFIAPFEGIFRRTVNPGIETASVFEPSTLLAIIVYGVVAVGIAKLISISAGEKEAVS